MSQPSVTIGADEAPEDRFVHPALVRSSGTIRPGINQASANETRKKPKNVDYFTPDATTFDDQRDVKALLEKYADQDGHIRRLPLWLNDDDFELIAPHGLFLFQGNKLKCRSTTQKGGLQANCTDADGNRFAKSCVPEECPDYQASPKKCRFSGRLFFYAPGQLSPNPLMLTTSSLNGFRLLWSALMQVLRIRGRISLTHKGAPFFELIKVKKLVARKDGDKLVRVPQWLPALSLTVDPMELICDNDARTTYFAPNVPLGPSLALQIGQADPESAPAYQGLQAEQAEPPAPQAAGTPGPQPADQPPPAATPADQAPPGTAAPINPTQPGQAPPIAAETSQAPKAGKAALPAAAGAQSSMVGQTPPAAAPTAGSLKNDIVRCLPLLGVSSSQMVIWSRRIAGTPVNSMGLPALTNLLNMLKATIDHQSPWALDEITLAWCLERLDVSFEDFNFWLEATSGPSWTQAVSQKITSKLMQNIRARVSSDLDSFKHEIEEAAALRRAA